MATAATNTAKTPTRAAAPPSAAPPAQVRRVDAPHDPTLLAETQRQIRALIAEIEQLAASHINVNEFYGKFLPRVVTALAASGGAIWTKSADGDFTLAAHVHLPPFGRDKSQVERHSQLLEQCWKTFAEPQCLPPRTAAQAGTPSNPTENLLLLVPLGEAKQTSALVEIFQRPGGGPAAQRGYLRFLAEMCGHATRFLQSSRLREFQQEQSQWQQLESFVTSIHRHLDSRQTAFTLASEGRRVSGADRVSVLWGAKRPRLIAVSGLDTIDRRAAEVRRMEKLAHVVLKAGAPVYFAGDSAQLAPQVDDALHEFVDRSQARAVCVLPLVPPTDEQKPAKPLGVLVIERWHQSQWSDHARQRHASIASHGALALAKANEHQSLFLLPLWKALGKFAWRTQVPKALLAAGAIAGVAAALMYIQHDFQLTARGKLQPSDRRDIFAATDGVVVDVPIDHAEIVAPGQTLVTLRDTKLDLEIATLLGKQTTLTEQLATAQQSLLRQSQLSVEEQNRVNGEILELKQAAESTARQLELYAARQAQLVVRSDRKAQVMTWHVRDLLLSRPVQRGEVLLQLADPDGPWELELELPEKRLEHALAAQELAAKHGRSLEVAFQLSTHPGQEFHGAVVEIERRAEPRGETGNVVRVRVAIDKSRLPPLHSETTVTAQLRCGNRPLGYVLFQDVIETVQKQALLWF